MPWGEPHTLGVGSTRDVEDAHRLLNDLNIRPNGLALRIIHLIAILEQMPAEIMESIRKNGVYSKKRGSETRCYDNDLSVLNVGQPRDLNKRQG